MARRRSRTVAPILSLLTWWLLCSSPQIGGDQSQGAEFLREFTLIRRESLHEDFLSDLLNNNHKIEDLVTLWQGLEKQQFKKQKPQDFFSFVYQAV